MKTRLQAILFALLLGASAAVQGQFLYTTNNGAITITGYTSGAGAWTIPGAINGLPVTSIGDHALEGCPNLVNVAIPNSVTQIGDFAFFACPGLTNITIAASVFSIGDRALADCGQLKTIKVDPNNPYYTNSPGGALYDNSETTLIQCPGGATNSWHTMASCTTIGDFAVAYCTGITNYEITDNVWDIGAFAFYGCSGLKAFKVDPNNQYYTNSPSGELYDNSETTLIQCPGGATGSRRTLSSCTSIGDYAVAYCSGLTNFTITADVSYIGTRAVSGCTALKSITVEAANQDYFSSPDGVLFDSYQSTLIQFPGGKTGSYVIPASVTDIGYAAFYQCQLASVYVGSGVNFIDQYAFADAYNLTNITVASNDPAYSSKAGVLFDASQSTLLQYPAGRSGGYRVPGGVTDLGYAAFLGTSKLTSMIVPPSVNYVEQFAFKYCGSLTNVSFQGNAPAVSSSPGDPPFVGTTPFYGSPNAIVYYLQSTSGWGPQFAGQTAKPNQIADTTSPTLTITAPARNQHWSNAVYTVSGTATDAWMVTGVYYSLNSGAWTSAVTTTDWDTWSAGVTLIPGTNTVAAYAINAGGNYSAIVTVSFVYVPPPLPTVTQSIDFDPAQFNPPVNPSALAYPTNFTLTAISTPLDPSGTSVTFQTTTAAGTAYIDANNVLWVTNSGTFTVTASEPAVLLAGTNYPAASTNLNFTVAAHVTNNSLSFNPALNLVYGAATPLSASATAGTPVFAAAPATVAVITQRTNLVIKGVGKFTVTASVPTLMMGGVIYLSNSVSLQFASTLAPLTITANNTNRVFGAANPAFTVSYAGFANGDTAASVFTGPPALTTTATSSSLPGSYWINATGWPFKNGITNYLVDFFPGTLFISARTNSQTIQFAPLHNPTNLVYGTNIALIATTTPPGAVLTFAITRSIPTNIASIDTSSLQINGVGTFTVTATALAWDGTNGTNYLVASTNLNFAALKARLLVTENASRTQGSTNTVFTPVYSGFVNGDGSNVLHGSPLAVVTNKANSNTAIGTYSNFVLVSQGTLNATNYSFSFAPGTLSISAPILTLAALANFLGTNQLDTNELAFILTNNYAHPAVVYPGLLADFLGSTNLNRVDINDLNLFLNYYYSPTSDVPLATPAKDLRAPINMLDQAGLNVALAHYTGWPNGPSFTNLPPYLAAAGGGAGQTNYCFTITNFNFTVQFSSDLVHWTNLDLPGQIQFTDPNAPATPNGFYRLLNATGN